MNFKGHLYSSMLVSLPLLAFLETNTTVDSTISLLSVPAFIAGGNFPDLDTDSKPSQYVAVMAFVVCLLLSAVGVFLWIIEFILLSNIIGIIFLLIKTFGHRGLTHKYYVPIVMVAFSFSGLIDGELVPVLSLSFALGNFLHLAMDKIWPWKKVAWNFKYRGSK